MANSKKQIKDVAPPPEPDTTSFYGAEEDTSEMDKILAEKKNDDHESDSEKS